MHEGGGEALEGERAEEETRKRGKGEQEGIVKRADDSDVIWGRRGVKGEGREREGKGREREHIDTWK